MAEASSTGTELAMSGGLGLEPYGNDPSTEQKSGFMDSIGGADTMRQVVLVIALVICVAIAVVIFLWARQPDYRPLGKMQTQELVETLDYFDQNQIDYRLEGSTVLVNSEQYQSIKMGMTRQGIAQTEGEGTDIIMQDMGFGVSQRVEKERLKHAREKQIASTIEEMQGISRARVLLALPVENVFARREKKASATVVVTSRRGSVISNEEVNAIVDIVASAVQGMEPSRVTVTDSNGRLLNSGSQDADSARSRKEYELEKQRESEYLSKIDSILIPVLGLGNYTAQADVTMDFTAVEQTQRSYNPDLPAIRSEMTVEDNSVGGVIAGIPGALTNQPPLDANIPEQATGGNGTASVPGRNLKEATRNYELDTTVSHTKQQTGVIRRLSVSVALDYVATTAADGTQTSAPRSQAELLDIRRLLQGGIGFDVTRGDSLEVVSIPFSRELDLAPIDVPFWQDPSNYPLMKLVGAVLVTIFLILFVLRPLVRKLIYPDEATKDEYDADDALDLGDDVGLLAQEFDESQVGFAADGTFRLPDLHKDEDLLRAVRALVANEPELSSQVVKNWLLQDE